MHDSCVQPSSVLGHPPSMLHSWWHSWSPSFHVALTVALTVALLPPSTWHSWWPSWMSSFHAPTLLLQFLSSVRKHVSTASPAKVPPQVVPVSPVQDAADAVFDALDLNQDGFLDRTEWNQANLLPKSPTKPALAPVSAPAPPVMHAECAPTPEASKPEPAHSAPKDSSTIHKDSSPIHENSSPRKMQTVTFATEDVILNREEERSTANNAVALASGSTAHNEVALACSTAHNAVALASASATSNVSASTCTVHEPVPTAGPSVVPSVPQECTPDMQRAKALEEELNRMRIETERVGAAPMM